MDKDQMILFLITNGAWILWACSHLWIHHQKTISRFLPKEDAET